MSSRPLAAILRDLDVLRVELEEALRPALDAEAGEGSARPKKQVHRPVRRPDAPVDELARRRAMNFLRDHGYAKR